jgi:hypothetical protein
MIYLVLELLHLIEVVGDTANDFQGEVTNRF